MLRRADERAGLFGCVGGQAHCRRWELQRVAGDVPSGVAWSGHVPLASVSVSADGGASWREASLEAGADRFAWRRFTAPVKTNSLGPVTIMARATDAKGGAQPLDGAPWNPRGYCNNAVHRVVGAIVPP